MIEDGFYLILAAKGNQLSSICEIKKPNIEFFQVHSQLDGTRLVNHCVVDGSCTEFGHREIYKRNFDVGVSLEDIILCSPDYANIEADDYRIVKSAFRPGEFYPMVFRPILNISNRPRASKAYSFSDDETYPLFEENYSTYKNKLPQYELILDDLLNLFKYIEPVPKNYNTYGHVIRNIILLACTEVENLFKSFLKEHDYNFTRRLSMNNYRIINEYLHLEKAYAYFPRYTKCSFQRPFEAWKENKPLPWYSAYNDLKHDREEHYEKATFENAILSVAAIGIILVRMYGQGNSLWDERAGKVIKVCYQDFSTEDYYIPPMCEDRRILEWKPKKIFETPIIQGSNRKNDT